MARKRPATRDPAEESFFAAVDVLRAHPMFAPLLAHAGVHRYPGNLCPDDGWAAVSESGGIHTHPTRRGEPEEWVYVVAHCLLHLGFGHFEGYRERWREWNAACDCFVAAFLADLKLGRPPGGPVRELPGRSEDRLYAQFCREGIPAQLARLGTAGPHDDMLRSESRVWYGAPMDWRACFGRGLSMAVTSAVNVAAGREAHLGADQRLVTDATRARDWFIASYPLLGALAAAFDIVEDPQLCARLGISIAAVDAESQEIFINPAAGLDEHECRFVMAHELLHVGLRHQARREGRDPFLWNVACDYVINGWLVEMKVGDLPQLGALHDPELKDESAEAVYDRIVSDTRRFRKLATLRGVGVGDMLERGVPRHTRPGDGVDLDEFYRRCMGQGLAYHEEAGRGLLPAGLVEEIRALAQPPIPWDVRLARWFDDHFAPLETVRTYARPSRRQSSTPDIPRPRWVPAPGAEDGRTFGVVLDTSGSMDRDLLAKALGTIASYSIARDVAAVRVVFCDAATYDEGYMAPDAIADRVRVKGRGGTILQPAIDLLERAEDFPPAGPLLVITDGQCDRLRIRREHAFLLPRGRRLPFVPRGEVFRID